MKNILFIFHFIFLFGQISAQTNIKVLFYNLLQFDGFDNRKYDLKYILDTYNPDIFGVCELKSEAASDTILNVCLNYGSTDTYRAASFHYNTSGSYQDLNQLLFYNNDLFELTYQDILQTSVRDINHYQLKLRTQDPNNEIYLEVFVAHFKSSDGNTNEQTRLDMATVFVNYLNNIPTDHYILFMGDFNLYSSSEPAYQKILDINNPIIMNDPIDSPGVWHNNSSFSHIHTQATHLYGNSLFVGGGLDDRFDFIMVSENLMDFQNPHLRYKNQSYRAYGNNGTCFNESIVSTACDNGIYDLVLRNHLYNMSDHLPVVMEMETDATLSVSYDFVTNAFHISGQHPVKNTLTIDGPVDFPVFIKLYNLLGQQLKEIPHYNIHTPIDVSNLSSDIYFLEITYNNYRQLLKFVKSD